MRGPVFAHADRVVREDVKHRQAHEGGQADRRPHVIGEDEERGAERAQPGEGHAVDDRAHGMLADAEVQIAAAVAAGLEIAAAVNKRERRGGQVGRPAHQPRQPLGDLIEHLARTGPRGQPLGVGGKRFDLGVPAGGQFVPPDAIEFAGLLGELPRIFGITRFPGLAERLCRGRRCSRGNGPALLPGTRNFWSSGQP